MAHFLKLQLVLKILENNILNNNKKREKKLLENTEKLYIFLHQEISFNSRMICIKNCFYPLSFTTQLLKSLINLTPRSAKSLKTWKY